MSPTTLDSPTDDGDEFDFASLDPANLMKQALGEQVELPPRGGAAAEKETQTQEKVLDPLDPAALMRQEAAPPQSTPTEVAGRPEGTNMRKLREAREAAEKERDTLRTERDTLAGKLADLEPRARGYESEKERLEKELASREESLLEAQAQAWQVAARESPAWREKADAIRNAAAAVQEIMALPILKENGIQHQPVTLLDPAARVALNETIRVLNEGGHYAEAQDLIDSHRAVNAWRGELRRIEEGAAENAKTWASKREESANTALRGAREDLARANPIHDTRSAEFQTLSKDQQEFLLNQHSAAEQAAREILTRVNRPAELVQDTYRTQLSLRLYAQANTGLQAQVESAHKELAAAKAQLAAYEKAAGGTSLGAGGGGGHHSNDPEDLVEQARMLDPRNLPGYNGL